MSTDKIKNHINAIFDKQIKHSPKYKVHKQLFNLTYNLSPTEWRNIRTKEYWLINDKLEYDAKKQHTLNCVIAYLQNNTNILHPCPIANEYCINHSYCSEIGFCAKCD